MQKIFLAFFFSLMPLLASSTIDTVKKAITITNSTTLKKAQKIAQKLSNFDIYIYKTTTTQTPYFILYAVNLEKNSLSANLKNIKKLYSGAYRSSDKRIKTLASNNFDKNIFISKLTKNVIEKKNKPNIQSSKDLNKRIDKILNKINNAPLVKKNTWIIPTKKAITLHDPIYIKEAKYLADKYSYYDTFIHKNTYNFTVSVVNIDKKNIKPILNSILKDVPTATLTSQSQIDYFYKQKSNKNDIFTPASKQKSIENIKKLAEEKNKIFLFAKEQFDKKNYKKAAIYLSDFIQDNNSHIDANFLLGRSYYNMHQFEQALATYQKILIINENLPRVKLELAQTYLALNMDSDATKEFNEVLASNIPDKVKNNIKQRLLYIKSRNTKHRFNYMLAINFLSDDNVNNTTAKDSYEIWSSLFNSYLTLYPDTIASDKSTMYQFGINHNYHLLDDLSIESNFMSLSQNFDKYKDKKSNIILFSSYLSKTTNTEKTSTGFEFTHTKLNNKNYQKNVGLGFNYSRRCSENITRSVNIKLFEKEFYDDITTSTDETDKNSHNLALILQQRLRTNKHGSFALSLLANKENKDKGTRTDVSHIGYGLSGSNTYRWTNDFSSTITASYAKKDYTLEDVNFLTKRSDAIDNLSLALHYKLKKNISTTYTVSNIRSKSNQEPYDYKKVTHNFGVMFSF